VTGPHPDGPGPTGPTTTGARRYEIRVAGHLDDHWAATLGDLTLVRLDDGTTSLTGPVVDQARLHGVLTRIRDLGVPLLTLRTLDGPYGSQEPVWDPTRRPAPAGDRSEHRALDPPAGPGERRHGDVIDEDRNAFATSPPASWRGDEVHARSTRPSSGHLLTGRCG
jgi:hypothetical protein